MALAERSSPMAWRSFFRGLLISVRTFWKRSRPKPKSKQWDGGNPGNLLTRGAPPRKPAVWHQLWCGVPHRPNAFPSSPLAIFHTHRNPRRVYPAIWEIVLVFKSPAPCPQDYIFFGSKGPIFFTSLVFILEVKFSFSINISRLVPLPVPSIRSQYRERLSSRQNIIVAGYESRYNGYQVFHHRVATNKTEFTLALTNSACARGENRH